MRILVLSDTHRDVHTLTGVLDHRVDAKLVIHLGDGLGDIEPLAACYPGRRFLWVRGNCDFGSDAPAEGLTVEENKRIVLTHGHAHGVKYGIYDISAWARGQRADILLFGHTHMPLVGYRDGLHILNPGSLAGSRTGAKTYGLIDITPAGIVPHLVEHRG